jgi:transcriptional regulator with GAF, ATPase, and Fis domain
VIVAGETVFCVVALQAQRFQVGEALLANGSTQKFIAQRYHTTEANLHNWMKKHGIRKPQSASPLG